MDEKNIVNVEENTKKDNKKNVLIAVLFCIIFALVGLGVGYYFGTKNVPANENKVEDKTEEKKNNKDEEKKTEDKDETKKESSSEEKKENNTENKSTNKEENKVEVKDNKEIKAYSSSNSLKDLLLKEGYILIESKSLYESKEGIDSAGDSFKNGSKTVYFSCSYELTSTKPSCKKEADGIIPSISVSIFNDYYAVAINRGTGSEYVYVYDSSLNKVAVGENVVYFDSKNVFYINGECEGKRSDGSVGNVDIVHKYNFETKKDIVLFNIDHDAGWTC